MNEKNEVDKVDDVMLPGFRFHPTDEELVGYYLKRKIQEQSLPIELIKQVDIYKYNPWDLPKLACTGEKEWYFYCPRDRKYRNSARPNRVTGAGFWKATGTDRPIYSSDGSKCIGLKKSLVFYTGRAAKGIKTNWMMHEFRLPPLYHSAHPKKALDKTLPPNDSWAICRIFKKANTMAQRAISHSWVSPSPITMEESNILSEDAFCAQLSPENISCTAENRSPVSCAPKYATASYKSAELPFPSGDIPSSAYEMLAPPKISVDVSSMLLWDGKISDGTDFEEPQQRFNGYSMNLLQGMQGNMETKGSEASLRNDPSADPAYNNLQWESNVRSIGFPFALPSSAPEAWKPNLPWESSSTSPSEMSSSTSNSTRKGFTWCSR